MSCSGVVVTTPPPPTGPPIVARGPLLDIVARDPPTLPVDVRWLPIC
jgi:hypothetical protein